MGVARNIREGKLESAHVVTNRNTEIKLPPLEAVERYVIVWSFSLHIYLLLFFLIT